MQHISFDDDLGINLLLLPPVPYPPTIPSTYPYFLRLTFLSEHHIINTCIHRYRYHYATNNMLLFSVIISETMPLRAEVPGPVL